MRYMTIKDLYQHNRKEIDYFFATFETAYLPFEFPLVPKDAGDLKKNNNIDKTIQQHITNGNAVMVGIYFNGNSEYIQWGDRSFQSSEMFYHTILIRSLVEMPSGKLSYRWDCSTCKSSNKIKQEAREFKINKYITLKLEGLETVIYVAGKRFNHCKYVLLNLSPEDIPDYDEINDMDEAIELYTKKQMERAVKSDNQKREKLEGFDRKHERDKMVLHPLTAFWGHSSNLQAWADNDYNLNVLHSSLSFSLLSKLIEVGDPKAKIALKEEIIARIKDGYNDKVIKYFFNERYMDLFTAEELESVFEECINQDILQRINKLISRKRIDERLMEKLQKEGKRTYESSWRY